MSQLLTDLRSCLNGALPNATCKLLSDAADEIEALEKKVYVPGQWRCPKCNFRLTQSNLYVASGTVGPRDEAGDKCPNCNGPLWRVSAMEDRTEAYKTALDTFEQVERYRGALRTIRDCPGTAKQLQDIAIVTLGVDG